MFQELLLLPRSGRYGSPANSNDILPCIYGDMTENTTEGAWALPCIDTGNNIYCFSGWPVLSVTDGNTITLYDDDGEIGAGEYTFDESHDVESQGAIATVTFSVPPTGTVTGKGKGKAPAGTLLTNPVAVLEDLLDYCEETITGFTWTADPTSFARAEQLCTSESFTCAGALLSDNVSAFWLNAICASFLMDWWIGNTGALYLRVDVAGSEYAVAGDLLERRTTSILGRQNKANLCNQVIANYALSFATIDLRFKENLNPNYYMTDDGTSTLSSASQVIYGARRLVKDFDWTRNTNTVNNRQARIITRYAYPVWLIDWQEIDFRNIHVEAGDFVRYSWEERKDETGLPLRNQIAQVIERAQDCDGLLTSCTLRDTGVYWRLPPGYFDGVSTVGDGGVFGGARDRRRLG